MAFGVRDALLVLRARDQATRVILDVGRSLSHLDDASRALATRQIQVGQALMGVGAAATFVGGALLAFYGSAVVAAAEYNRESSLTLTQVDQLGVTLEQVAQIGMNVAKAIPAPFEQMQKSLFDIFSSMEVDLAQAEVLLTAFAKGAVAGQTDVQTAGRATISILNAFKIPVEDVNRVMDIQFQIVRKGVITYEEFATTIGRAIPSAQRAGQSIETLGALIAFMTRNGLSAAAATVSAARAMDMFANPKFASNIGELGIAVTDVHGAFRPIPDVVNDLRVKFGELAPAQRTLEFLKLGGEGSLEALEALGIQVRDTSGNMRDMSVVGQELHDKFAGLSEEEVSTALADLGSGAGGTIQAMRFLNLAVGDSSGLLNQMVSDMHNAGGAAGAAYDIMKETPAMKLQELKNRFEIIRVEIGTRLMPIAMRLLDWVISALKWWDNLSDSTQGLITKIGLFTAVLITIVGVVTFIVGTILLLTGTLALLGTSLGAVAAIVGVVVGAIAGVIAAFLTLTEVLGLDTYQAIMIIMSVFFPFIRIITMIMALARALGISWSDVGQVMKTVWGIIVDAALSGWAQIQNVWQFMQDAWDAVTRVATSAWQIMQDVWDGITQAAVSAWQAIQPVWQFMQDAWDLITGVAVAAWHIYVAVWQGIASVVNTAWDIMSPFFNLMVAVIGMILFVIKELVQFWVGVAWVAISTAVQVAWAIIQVIWDVMLFVIKLIIAIVKDLWNMWEAAWNIIGIAVEVAWAAIQVVWDIMLAYIKVIIAIAQDLFNIWKNVVWDPMAAVLEVVWNAIIKPIWDALVGFVQDVIIPILQTLWNIFQTVWDQISDKAVTVWHGIIQPIWQGIKDFIEGTLIPAIRIIKDVADEVFDAFGAAAERGFGFAKNAIMTSLSAIGSLVSGFLSVVASVADTVGLDNVAGVLRDASNAAQGWGKESGGVIGLATGGVAPFVTDGIRAIVGEGNPAYPEYVIPTDPKYRGRAVGLFNDLGPKLMAEGGVIGGLKGIFGAAVDAAEWTIDKVRELSAYGLSKIWPKLDAPDSLAGIPPGAINTLRDTVIDLIAGKAQEKANAERPPPGEVGTGQIGNGWQAITNWLSSVGEPYTITSTNRPGSITSSGNLSNHALGKAVDLVSDNMMRLFDTLRGIGVSLSELFYDPAGYSIKNGVRADFIVGGHTDHVHAATFDNGGVLHPGLNYVWNKTGAFEHLVPALEAGGWPTGRAIQPLQDYMTAMLSSMTPGEGLGSLPLSAQLGVGIMNRVASSLVTPLATKIPSMVGANTSVSNVINKFNISVPINVTGLTDQAAAERVGAEVEARIQEIVDELHNRGL